MGRFPFSDKAAHPPLPAWRLSLSFSGNGLVSVLAGRLNARPRVVMVVDAYLRAGNALQSPHRSPLDLLSNTAHSLYPLQATSPYLQCSSPASLPPSWLLVSCITTTRFNRRSLTGLIVLAAASSLASPIPADSLSKKEVPAVKYNILVREPEAQDSKLEVLAREPEDVEVREPSPMCGPRGCY